MQCRYNLDAGPDGDTGRPEGADERTVDRRCGWSTRFNADGEDDENADVDADAAAVQMLAPAEMRTLVEMAVQWEREPAAVPVPERVLLTPEPLVAAPLSQEKGCSHLSATHHWRGRGSQAWSYSPKEGAASPACARIGSYMEAS